MDNNELRRQIRILEEEIDHLPKGNVSYKKINGKEQPYLQWTEDGKRHSKYIKVQGRTEVLAGIERRDRLQKELDELRLNHAVSFNESKEMTGLSQPSQFNFQTQPWFMHDNSVAYNPFHCAVRTGDDLERFTEPVRAFRRRECYAQLEDYIYHDTSEKVLVLYGLRRTGKTTLIRQLILNMDSEMRNKTVFIQTAAGSTLANLNQDLKLLEQNGFKYVFIDEVTMMEDFIGGAALLSDIFVASGMKIVLSGTDSLGFLFAKDEQLYDRCRLLHTTFIPYREFERVLDIQGVDEYIRYGGTMSLSGTLYNETSTFASEQTTGEYVDSSIALNIQHSLQHYQHAGHFRSLQELYERNELTSVINRVVEDMNHRFTVETLTREFRSSDLAISAGNLRRDRSNPTDILDRVNIKDVTKRLIKLLEIRNKEDQTVEIQKTHAAEVKEYLDLLDLTMDIDIVSLQNPGAHGTRTAFTQPGLRYAQVDALISSLLRDEEFAKLSLSERRFVEGRIRSEVMGRMLEDIVLLETKISFPKKEVFKLQFAVGEFDMVVFNPDEGCCEIYEIKHSDQVVPEQQRVLHDKKKCADTEHRFGPITGKYVLYRGADCEAGDIRYRNVEGYLESLGRKE